VKLEIGGGERLQPGFLNVDVNPRSADVIGSALALPFRDGTITALRAVDCAEHCSYRVTDEMFAEWARVCAPAATLYVQVPDAHEIMRRYIAGNIDALRTPDDLPDTRLAGATWRLLGGHQDGKYCKEGDDFRWNAHFALFSAASLRVALETAGFHVDSIVTNPHPNLCCDAVRL
jgi:predicted SAM-dependent methyltransferase